MKFLKKFFRHPKLIVAVCLLVTAGCGFFIKNLTLDNSIRQFFPQKDVSYTRMTETEDQFGSMLSIGLTLEAKDGTILTPEYIDVVRKITDRALSIKEVENIDSLTHIDYVCEQDGSICATQLIPDTYTGTEEDINLLRSRLSEWDDMYGRVIINDDGTATQMQITISPNKTSESDSTRQQRVLDEVRSIAKEETKGHSLKFKLAGEPVLSENSRAFMMSDLMRLIPLVIIVVLLSLFLSFKTVDGTILPLITVLMSTVISCGLMGMFGVTFTLVSSVIPVALIAVGSAYGIHVLTHYYVALDSIEGELTKEKYEECVFSGLKEVWTAVLLAGLTTIVGFISLVSSPIGPLHSFSVFTAIGVALSLIFSVTFIPAVLLLKDLSKVRTKSRRIAKLTDKMKSRLEKAKKLRGGKEEDEASADTLYSIFKFFCGSKTRLVLTSLAIVALSLTGLRLLKIDTALINYFPKTAQFRQDLDYIDKDFAGTNSVFFTITGPEKGDIANPELLKAVDDMQNQLQEDHESIGKIVSLTTFIKRINQVWHVPTTETVQETQTAAVSEEDSAQTADLSWGDDSDWGSSDSLSWGDDETSEEETVPQVQFNDPNTEYAKVLSGTMTTKEVLDLLNEAYTAAGGKNATTDEIVDELMKKTNYNGAAYYEIPYDTAKYPVASREELKGVVNGYLTLLSGSLGRFIDDDMNPQTMRITCQLRSHSTDETGSIIADAKKFAQERFPEGYTLEATGSGEMEYTMTKRIVSSQFSSLAVSLISVFIIIAVSFKSVWAGLLGAVPLALAILLNYMTMGFAHINLDLVTSIIASVAVGVGIDYTIHFLTTYREERAKSDDIVLVTKMTFKKSGHGIMTNAVAVGLGFLVLCLSKFTVLKYIGVLVAIVMFTSSFLAMTIIPGILNLTDPKFIRPKEK